jgi:hypothetical protein
MGVAALAAVVSVAGEAVVVAPTAGMAATAMEDMAGAETMAVMVDVVAVDMVVDLPAATTSPASPHFEYVYLPLIFYLFIYYKRWTSCTSIPVCHRLPLPLLHPTL